MHKAKALRVVGQKAVSMIAVVFLLAFGFAEIAAAQNDSPNQKNIIILLADDLGWGDVGFHGGVASTPNIDRLAAGGLEIDRFYAYPACSPSRAALLTGRFPQRFGITGPVRPRDVGLPLTERLLVKDFQDAGYQTSLIGKWHLNHSDDIKLNPTARGFDHFYGFLQASIDYFKHTGNREKIDWQRNGVTVNEEGYATDLLTQEAVKLVAKRDKGKPLCMVVAYNAPHAPLQAPEELIAKYRGKLKQQAATYAAMVESLDQGVGQIIDAVDQQGMKNDTIIVFASDNGAARNGTNKPLRGQKRQVYEGGIRVPCVLYAPGIIPPGKNTKQLVAIEDLLPTLASAAGVKLKERKPLDGLDLWRALVDGKTKPRSMVIAEQNFAIFDGSWKLIQSDSSTELFDILNDPNETEDLFNSHRPIAGFLTDDLEEFKRRVKADQPVKAAVKNTSQNTSQTAESPKAKTNTEGEALTNATLAGDAQFGELGNRLTESNGKGIRMLSALDYNKDSQHSGEASVIREVTAEDRWYRFDITAMAEDNFSVQKDNLYLKVEFLQKDSGDSLDSIKTRIYPQVVRERNDLKDNRTNKNLGNGAWRTYGMDFRTPFAEVDAVKLSVGFSDGDGKGKNSEFWINTMNLIPIPVPTDYKAPENKVRARPQPVFESLVALGGRWYFDPSNGPIDLPEQFDHTNADRLLYQSDHFEAPFAGNMTSWLRAGYKDLDGNIVKEDQYKPDAVVITITDDYIVIKSRNLPNHPTATFPDKWRLLDGNPSYIQEKNNTWYLPKVPKLAANPIAMDDKNANGALPMGPIGVATNGVIFFNPFDHIFETDAVWRLDRCCGHPSPQSAYHYHKYPVCVKTPWTDAGKSHSPVLGFAFDGLPVYGPYEADGLLAKDDTQNPLNDFNLHEDPQRGPHYHVTPGKFPHIIGGYWAQLDPKNSRRRGPRQ